MLWYLIEFEQAVWFNLVKLKCNDAVRQCFIEVVLVNISKELLNINNKKKNQEEEEEEEKEWKEEKNTYFWFKIL